MSRCGHGFRCSIATRYPTQSRDPEDWGGDLGLIRKVRQHRSPEDPTNPTDGDAAGKAALTCWDRQCGLSLRPIKIGEPIEENIGKRMFCEVSEKLSVHRYEERRSLRAQEEAR
jgi:hypothetical protein